MFLILIRNFFGKTYNDITEESQNIQSFQIESFEISKDYLIDHVYTQSSQFQKIQARFEKLYSTIPPRTPT